MAVLCGTAAASSLQTLMDQGHLNIRTQLAPKTAIVARQRLELTLEIETDTWLGRDILIDPIVVDRAVVMQNRLPPKRFVRTRQGKTFSVIQWKIPIYPMIAGDFTLSPVMVNLAVTDKMGKMIQGSVTTKGIGFNAGYPPGLDHGDTWVAASEFTVTQQFDRDLDRLEPGDAFIRTVTFQGKGVDAAMLPDLQPEPVKGLQSHQGPARVKDGDGRGEQLASRIQTFTYVVEKKGPYLLPAIQYDWWDLSSQKLKSITLPETLINPSIKKEFSWTGSLSADIFWGQGSLSGGRITLAAILIAVLLLVVIAVSRRHKKNLGKIQGRDSSPSKTRCQLKRSILRACKAKKYTLMTSGLYEWVGRYGRERLKDCLKHPAKQPGEADVLVHKPGTELAKILALVYGRKKVEIDRKALLAEVRSLVVRVKWPRFQKRNPMG